MSNSHPDTCIVRRCNNETETPDYITLRSVNQRPKIQILVQDNYQYIDTHKAEARILQFSNFQLQFSSIHFSKNLQSYNFQFYYSRQSVPGGKSSSWHERHNADLQDKFPGVQPVKYYERILTARIFRINFIEVPGRTTCKYYERIFRGYFGSELRIVLRFPASIISQKKSIKKITQMIV